MIHLYIVRHGETKENVEQILQGHLQGQLTEKGIQQALTLQQKLAKEVRIDRIISSDLQRTADTAQILNQPFSLNIEYSSLLRERDWGEYTGMAIANIPKGDFPPSVESISEMMQRAKSFLKHLLSKSSPSSATQNILIVSHGVFSRCLQAAALHKTIYDIPKMNNMEVREIHISQPSATFEESIAKEDNSYIFTNGQEN